mgnify:CR=1 FL=1
MHKPKLVKVEFLGTDIVLESVRHVPVMAKGLNPFTHFECNGKGWIMVGTPDSLFGDLYERFKPSLRDAEKASGIDQYYPD